jgi:chromosome segregation ATPase
MGDHVETGYFQTSVSSILEIDEQVEKVATPNQMPSGPDFSKLPSNALRSSAVETLLGQNADLMARLGVALRKGGALETRVTELQTENLHLRHRFEVNKDQMLVLQEKERIISNRSAQTATETATLKDRLALLERRYADVYSNSQSLQRQLRRLQNYRARIRNASKNLKTKAAAVFSSLLMTDNQNKTVSEALKLAEQELKTLRSDNTATQIQIVNRYEGEAVGLRNELELHRRRAADRDMLYDAKVRIENQLVFEERQARQYREETQKELISLKEENFDLREQLKTRLIEMERIERETVQNAGQVARLESEVKEKSDQVLSLQLLWKDKQTELERLEEKNRSLQKLNQQLSVTLNAQRREIVDLKSDVEKEKFLASEKFKAIEQQLEQSVLVK